MLDIQLLRSDLAGVAKRLADRGFAFPAAEFEKLETNRKSVQTETQELQAKRNQLSKQVGQMKGKGEDASQLIAQVNAQADRLKALEQDLAKIQKDLDDFLLGVPNVPHASVPAGKSSEDNPEVRRYLEAENAYAETFLAPTVGLQETLYAEMLGRIKQTDLSVPYREKAFWYYSRTEEGRQYPIYCRKRESLEAPEEVLLDLNAMAEGHSYLALGALEVSDDGALLAYTVDVTGFREYDLHVLPLADRAPVAGPLPRVLVEPGRPVLLVYPAAMPARATDPAVDPLAGVLGATRAAVLRHLAEPGPHTTTALARGVGVGLSLDL